MNAEHKVTGPEQRRVYARQAALYARALHYPDWVNKSGNPEYERFLWDAHMAARKRP